MKAVVHQFGAPLSIEEVPVPEVGPGQILVNIKASGVCHTDLPAADGDWPVKPSLPFIPSHEGVGYVAAVGSGVRNVKEGDRVCVPWLCRIHSMCIPPFIARLAPVIKAASSEHRNATRAATSSGRPSRPIGICGRIFVSMMSRGTA